MGTIRPATPRDHPAIFRLVRNELVPRSSLPAPSPARLRRDLAARLGRGATFVADSPRMPVAGFVHLETRGATLFVDLLAVDPGERNRGCGGALMRLAERYGLERGCREIRLFVDERNAPAQRFYRRLGYWPLRRVAPLRVVEMYKPLFM